MQHDFSQHVETKHNGLCVFQLARVVERGSGKVFSQGVFAKRHVRVCNAGKPVGGVAAEATLARSFGTLFVEIKRTVIVTQLKVAPPHIAKCRGDKSHLSQGPGKLESCLILVDSGIKPFLTHCKSS